MSKYLQSAREMIEKAGHQMVAGNSKEATRFQQYALRDLLFHLEAQEEEAAALKPSEPSSAPMAGTASKPWPWSGASQVSYPGSSVLMGLILDYFRSTQYIEPKLEATWLDSSTLQLTLRWLGASTSTPADGGRGRADREDIPRMGPWPDSVLGAIKQETKRAVAHSETSSSVDTATVVEAPSTSTILWRWSCPVSPGGALSPSHLQDILASLSSLQFHGNTQEVEIGVTRTSKALTPPAGSPSPSTEESAHEASGVVGDCNHEWEDAQLRATNDGMYIKSVDYCAKCKSVSPAHEMLLETLALRKAKNGRAGALGHDDDAG